MHVSVVTKRARRKEISIWTNMKNQASISNSADVVTTIKVWYKIVELQKHGTIWQPIDGMINFFENIL